MSFKGNRNIQGFYRGREVIIAVWRVYAEAKGEMGTLGERLPQP